MLFKPSHRTAIHRTAIHMTAIHMTTITLLEVFFTIVCLGLFLTHSFLGAYKINSLCECSFSGLLENL